jgi:hypothetical protein
MHVTPFVATLILRECEDEDSHSQVSSYFGSWSLNGLPNLQRAIAEVKTCRNPILRESKDETHTPEMGTWEFSGTPKISEFDYKSQNTSHWGVLYIIGKLSKCKCRKWAYMGHLKHLQHKLWQKERSGVKLAI